MVLLGCSLPDVVLSAVADVPWSSKGRRRCDEGASPRVVIYVVIWPEAGRVGSATLSLREYDREGIQHHGSRTTPRRVQRSRVRNNRSVSYTHLTLPTNREV